MTECQPWHSVLWLGYSRPRSGWSTFGEYDDENRERLLLNVVIRDDNDSKFLQAWLTFGALEACTQQSLPDEALLIRKGADLVICLENLGDILVDVSRRVKAGELEEDTWARKTIDSLLDQRNFLDGLRRGPANGEIDVVPLNLLCVTLQIAEAVARAIPEIVGEDTALARSARQLLTWTQVSFSVTQAYEAYFGKIGACPRFVACIRRLTLVSAYVYAKHQERDNSCSGHESCTESACRKLNVADGTYGTVHVTADCCCPKLKPSSDAVFKLLGQGDIRVFKINSLFGDPENLFSIAEAMYVDYFAISHVWAHGLGSVTEVGLPTCQLQRLKQIVGDQYFWIDALGIPLDKTLRKAAMLRMSEIYAKAEKVIIIDNSLTNISQTQPIVSHLFQLYVSDWLSRLWTLPEAVLAQVLLISNSDSNKPLLDIFRLAFKQVVRSPLLTTLCNRITDLVPALSGREFDDAQSIPLRALVNQLERRSTSKPIDEVVAIAPLLDIGIEQLFDLDQESRMVRFLKQVHYLPKDIIFRRVQRIKSKNHGWVPFSLMQPLRLTGPSVAEFTDEGLHSEYEVLMFHERIFKDRIFSVFKALDRKLAFRVGLLCEGESDLSGTEVVCNALIICGNIVEKSGSCSATGIHCDQIDTSDSEIETRLSSSFQTAGFTVMWKPLDEISNSEEFPDASLRICQVLIK